MLLGSSHSQEHFKSTTLSVLWQVIHLVLKYQRTRESLFLKGRGVKSHWWQQDWQRDTAASPTKETIPQYLSKVAQQVLLQQTGSAESKSPFKSMVAWQVQYEVTEATLWVRSESASTDYCQAWPTEDSHLYCQYCHSQAECFELLRMLWDSLHMTLKPWNQDRNWEYIKYLVSKTCFEENHKNNCEVHARYYGRLVKAEIRLANSSNLICC